MQAFVGPVHEAAEVPLAVDSDWVLDAHTMLIDHCDLNHVVRFGVSAEEDLGGGNSMVP